MFHTHSLKLTCAFLALFAGAAEAGTVGYNFTGTVMGTHGPSEPLFAGVGIGSTVSGGFSYDDTTTSLTNDPFIGVYVFQNLFLQVGPLAYSLMNPILEIDSKNIYNWELGGKAGDPAFSLELVLQNSFAPYLYADVSLRPPPDPSAVDIHNGSIYIDHPGEANITGLIFNLDSVTACEAGPGVSRLPACNQPTSSTPEPASVGLVAVSIGVLCLRWRSRKGVA